MASSPSAMSDAGSMRATVSASCSARTPASCSSSATSASPDPVRSPCFSTSKWANSSEPSHSSRSTRAEKRGALPLVAVAHERRRPRSARAGSPRSTSCSTGPAAATVAGGRTRPSAAARAPSRSTREEVHRGRADEAGHEQVAPGAGRAPSAAPTCCSTPLRSTATRSPRVMRLGLVVGDVDGRGAEPVLQVGDLVAHLHAQLGVEVRERLVHQERGRLAHDARGPWRRAGAGRRRGCAGLRSRARRARAASAASSTRRCDLGLRHLRQLERERHVLAHGHVRVQRVALEHHRDVAVRGRRVVDDLAVDRAARPR